MGKVKVLSFWNLKSDDWGNFQFLGPTKKQIFDAKTVKIHHFWPRIFCCDHRHGYPAGRRKSPYKSVKVINFGHHNYNQRASTPTLSTPFLGAEA